MLFIRVDPVLPSEMVRSIEAARDSSRRRTGVSVLMDETVDLPAGRPYLVSHARRL